MSRVPPGDNSQRPWRASLGVALVLAGLPIAWVARYQVGASGNKLFPVLLTIAGVLLTATPGPSGLVRCFGKADLASFLFPFLFLSATLAWAVASEGLAEEGALGLMLATALLLCLRTTPWRLFRGMAPAVALVAATGCTATLVTARVGLSSQRAIAGDANSPNMLSFAGGLAVVAGVFMLREAFGRSLWQQTLATVAVFSGLVIVAVSVTRSTIVGLLLCAGWAVVRAFRRRIRRRAPKRRPGVIAAAVLSALCCAGVAAFTPLGDRVSNQAAELQVYLEDGINSYFGLSPAREASARSRRELADYAADDLSFSGYGYKAMYLDFPLLQGFYDGGLFGGVAYGLFTLIVPLYFLLGRVRASGDSGIVFASYVYVFYFPNLFVHGQPYDLSLIIPIVVFYGIAIRALSRPVRALQRTTPFAYPVT